MSEQNNNESQFKRAFNDKDEFMKYYNEHKEEIDKLTTKQLNSVYKIESCKITRNKNKIVVRSNSPKSKDSQTTERSKKDKEDKEDKKDKPKSNKKEIKPTDLNKMIDSLINHYEKQLTQLKEMKNKIVSEELFDSDASARQEQHNE